MKYLLPCSLCITTNTLCTLECLYAPFFPTHMVNLAEKVNNVFSHHYILTSLENFNLQQLPQSVSNLFIKNLFKEAAFRLANPVLGNHGRCKVLSINVKILQTKVAAQRAELHQLRLAFYRIQRMLVGEPQHSQQVTSERIVKIRNMQVAVGLGKVIKEVERELEAMKRVIDSWRNILPKVYVDYCINRQSNANSRSMRLLRLRSIFY